MGRSHPLATQSEFVHGPLRRRGKGGKKEVGASKKHLPGGYLSGGPGGGLSPPRVARRQASNSAHRSILMRLLPNGTSLDLLTAASAYTRGPVQGSLGTDFLLSAQYRCIYCQTALRSTF
jgi:hypothetical protein